MKPLLSFMSTYKSTHGNISVWFSNMLCFLLFYFLWKLINELQDVHTWAVFGQLISMQIFQEHRMERSHKIMFEKGFEVNDQISEVVIRTWVMEQHLSTKNNDAGDFSQKSQIGWNLVMLE